MNAISEIAGAIKEGFKILGQFMSGRQSRKLSQALDYAEKYIRRYEEITPADKRDRLMKKYADEFFERNNFVIINNKD